MESYIIQIFDSEINEHNRITCSSIVQRIPILESFAINDELRADAISILLNDTALNSFLSVNEENVLSYKGNIKQWIRNEWIPDIQKQSIALNEENIFSPTALYNIEALCKNCLKTDLLFVLSPTKHAFVYDSTKLVEFLSNIENGTQLYIGGIVGYKY